MDNTGFWTIIDSAMRQSSGDIDHAEDALVRGLATHLPREICEFQRILRSKLDTAYTWDLWGAAYFINAGCSDDGFEYFRLWLISRGRLIYERALRDPDTLADVIDPQGDAEDHEFESLLYVAHQAYQQTTGSEMPRENRVPPGVPAGTTWDFDDLNERALRLPRLSALLG